MRCDPSVMPACARPGLGAIASASPGVRSRCVCEGVCGCDICGRLAAVATAIVGFRTGIRTNPMNQFESLTFQGFMI